jgi:hypothetical protein
MEAQRQVAEGLCPAANRPDASSELQNAPTDELRRPRLVKRELYCPGRSCLRSGPARDPLRAGGRCRAMAPDDARPSGGGARAQKCARNVFVRGHSTRGRGACGHQGCSQPCRPTEAESRLAVATQAQTGRGSQAQQPVEVGEGPGRLWSSSGQEWTQDGGDHQLRLAESRPLTKAEGREWRTPTTISEQIAPRRSAVRVRLAPFVDVEVTTKCVQPGARGAPVACMESGQHSDPAQGSNVCPSALC